MDVSRSRCLQFIRLISNTRFVLAGIPVAFFQPYQPGVLDFSDTDITDETGVFRINAAAVIKASAAYVRGALADYESIHRLI